MNYTTYYDSLSKPFFSPPEWLFGVVWTPLYIIIIITFLFVFLRAVKGHIPRIVTLPFVLNLFFNLIFTPIQFSLRNNFLAIIDILLVVITLIWALVAIWNYHKWVSIINIPYLLWGTFATMLQISITVLNW